MFVELLKDFNPFEKGNVVQVVSFTDREVFVVLPDNSQKHEDAKILVLPKSTCILTSKTLPTNACVPVSMFRFMIGALNPSSQKESEVSSGDMSATLNCNFSSNEYHLVIAVDMYHL